MDASRKRKAANATPSSTDGSATKKIKLVNTRDVPSPAPAATAASRVKSVGLQLVENLRKGTDKSGRKIADLFLTLPPRDDLPDYYEFTKMPLAIDTIEDKINNGGYNTITEIESDFKRMVQNAKDYNDTKSQIHEDAERIRKLVYNYMKAHNPAYNEDPSYTSFPTPVPANGTVDTPTTSGRTSATPSRQAKTNAPVSALPVRRASSALDGPNGEAVEHESGVSFNGLTFQAAQATIIDHLVKTTDEEGLEIFTPFANLPSRKLEDYYKVIKYPMSLKKVRKRIDGEHGRNERTGITDFKTWDAFEEEVSHIWRNAKDYNEDGSEMFELAKELEEHFKSLLEDAKSKVSGPNTKIKIGGPKPKVTLNLSHNNRPSPSPATTTVDNEALARQRQTVSAGANAKQVEQRQSPAAVNGSKRSTSQVPPTQQARPPSAVAAASPADAVKLEKAVSQSPAVSHAVPVVPTSTAPAAPVVAAPAPATNGSMPPPSIRPTSSSPYPSGQPPVSSYTFTAPALLPPTPLRPYPLAEALLPKVTISTHPQLKLATPLQMVIPPHQTLTQYSRTISLPPTHYSLQIAPTISKALSFGHPYKVFVTFNGNRLAQRDTQQDGALRVHLYESSLVQGVNRIEIEVAASRDGKDGLDIEKVTVFVNLMRA